MIKGIIFDMDGVLVLGANKFHVEAWDRAFKEQGIKLHMISVYEYGKLEGMKGDEIQRLILKQNNISLDPKIKEHIYKRKKEIFKEIENSYTPAETKLLLNNFKKQELKLALASGNNRTVVNNFLNKQNLHEFFDHIVSGDEIEKGKPDPEVFLKALEKLNLPKTEVIVVENSPLGVQAAKAAGIFVIAITSTLSSKFLAEADRTINNLSELNEISSFVASNTRC